MLDSLEDTYTFKMDFFPELIRSLAKKGVGTRPRMFKMEKPGFTVSGFLVEKYPLLGRASRTPVREYRSIPL